MDQPCVGFFKVVVRFAGSPIIVRICAKSEGAAYEAAGVLYSACEIVGCIGAEEHEKMSMVLADSAPSPFSPTSAAAFR